MKKAIIITIIAIVGLTTAGSAYAQPKEFSILDYNNVLSQYENGEYALAYNTLLDTKASTETVRAFGFSK